MSVFELVEDDTEIWPVGGLLEAVHFDEKQHPRWPKGTPRGGEFIRVGQSFGLEGKQYEVAHVVKGKIYAHLKGGKQAQTIEVKATAAKGFVAAHPDEVQVAKGIEAPTPSSLKGGKGQESTVTVVSPYVDHASHDPGVPVPVGSSITPGEWQRFGKLDQEHYTELQERFGKWSPGAAKALVDKSYAGYDAATQKVVQNSYSSQYGSSSGYSLSLISAVIKKLGLGSGGQLPPEAHEAREKAMELQGEHKAAVQWDLYNRARSPDIFAVHKTTDKPSWWSDILGGNKRVFSGLSQTFHYRVGGFGGTAVASPLAIRHVLLASQSAQPIPGSTHFPGELEISVPEQLKLDSRSVVFADSGIQANTQKWLAGVTKVPIGGYIHDMLRNHLQKGEPLPEIPEPAMVQMDGAGGKTWKDPEPEAWQGIAGRAVETGVANNLAVGDHFRKAGVTYQVTDINAKTGVVSGKAKTGGGEDATVKPFEEVEIAKPISVSGLNAGDYVMGLQGARYVIVDDPGDPTYGLRYVEITPNGPTGNAYQLKAGGSRQFFRLEGHYVATAKSVDEKPPFEPPGWTVGADTEKFVSKLPDGSKFKVNNDYYEVVHQLGTNGGQVKIMDLMTGKQGQINGSYKTQVLVPKAGYKPPPGTKVVSATGEVISLAADPDPGDFMPINGEKWEVLGIAKTGPDKGKVKLKRPGKPGLTHLDTTDPALQSLHKPSEYVIGEKAKLRDIPVGEKFQMGAGEKQKPYLVLEHGGPGKKSKVKDLGTGKEYEVSRNASYSKLVPNDEANAAATAEDPGALSPKDTPTPYDELTLGDTTQLGDLKPGDHFSAGPGLPVMMMVKPPTQDEKPLAAYMEASGAPGPSFQLELGNASLVQFHKHADEAGWKDTNPAVTASANAPEKDPGGFPQAQSIGFTPYGSAYASGGKEKGGFAGKHEKIGLMPVGTVFRDKLGKLWQVKKPGAQSIITDGQANYTVDGSLRGRASTVMTQMPHGDQSPPLGVPEVDSPHSVAKAGMVPNTALTLGDLKKGDLLQMPKGGIGEVVTTAGMVTAVKDIDTGKGTGIPNDYVPPLVGVSVPSALTDEQVLKTAKALLIRNDQKVSVSSMQPGDLIGLPHGKVAKITGLTPEGKVTSEDIPNGQKRVLLPSYVPKTAMIAFPPLETDALPGPAPMTGDHPLAPGMEPNMAFLTLAHLQPGELFQMPNGSAIYQVQSHDALGGVIAKSISGGSDFAGIVGSTEIFPAHQSPAGIGEGPDGGLGHDPSQWVKDADATQAADLPVGAVFETGSGVHWQITGPVEDGNVPVINLDNDGEPASLLPFQPAWQLHPKGGGAGPDLPLDAIADLTDQYPEGSKWKYGAGGFSAGDTVQVVGVWSDGTIGVVGQDGEAFAVDPDDLSPTASGALGQILADHPDANTKELGELALGDRFVEAGKVWKLTGVKSDGQFSAEPVGGGDAQLFHPQFVPAQVVQPLTAAEKALHDEGLQAGIEKAKSQLAGKAPAAPTYTGKKDIKAPSDPLQAALAASLAALQQPGPALSPADMSLAELEQKYGTLADIPSDGEEQTFPAYKSAWGTGGAYKHPALGTLEPGEHFVDKTGAGWTFAGMGPQNQAIIVSDTTGDALKVGAAKKVKLHPA